MLDFADATGGIGATGAIELAGEDGAVAAVTE
jgi:hypothetical protein